MNPLLKYIRSLKIFKKRRIYTERYSRERRKTLYEIKNNRNYIKRLTRIINILKKENKKNPDKEKEVAIQVHISELHGLQTENKKLAKKLKEKRQ